MKFFKKISGSKTSLYKRVAFIFLSIVFFGFVFLAYALLQTYLRRSVDGIVY